MIEVLDIISGGYRRVDKNSSAVIEKTNEDDWLMSSREHVVFRADSYV